MNSIFNILLLILGFSLIILGFSIKNEENKQVVVDLPEEINLATPSDTLIAIKRGDTLYVEFVFK